MFEKLLNMFTWLYMEADAGASGGAGDPTTQETQPDKKSGDSGHQQDDPNNPKWLPERLDKAKSSERRSIFETAKVKDMDELLKKIELANTYEQSQLTETQKTTKQIETLNQTIVDLNDKLKAAEERAAKVEQDRVSDRVDNALRLSVSNAKAKKVDDVLALLKLKHADKVARLANDKGEVDAKAVDALIEEFRKDRPEDFSVPGPGSPSNRGGKQPDPTKDAVRRASLINQRTIRG